MQRLSMQKNLLFYYITNYSTWTVYFLATSSRQNLRQRHFTLAFPSDFRFIPPKAPIFKQNKITVPRALSL